MRRSPVEAVISAIVSRLRASTGVTALVTGIYNDVPQASAYPYVVVSSPLDKRMDTFGQLGGETMIDVQAISQAHGDQEGVRILDQVGRALDLQPLSTTQHTTFGVAWDQNERYSNVVNGIQTRYHVSTYRVWTGQSSS